MKDAEYQINLRGKLSEKQQLQLQISELYQRASSVDDFYGLLKKSGVELYFRGKQPGIKAGRKYRLATLGFPHERIALIELRQEQRVKELKKILERSRSHKPGLQK